MKVKFIVSLLVSISLVACTPASKHVKQVRDNSADRMTVGKVQKEIRVGMSSATVAEVLGSPNVVTTDGNRQEVWVYDKVATENAYSTTSGGFSALVLGFGKNTGANSSTQRTLTVIVKFDKHARVRDFSYHTSTF